MRCPYCESLDDKVVDSRTAEEGAAIRRRRECLACGRRFTTFERLGDLPLVVVKRSGVKEPFDVRKLEAGIAKAVTTDAVEDGSAAALVAEVEEELRASGPEVTSEQVGLAILERLRALDPMAYLRFASVCKGFEDLADFERELGALTKTTEPKRR